MSRDDAAVAVMAVARSVEAAFRAVHDRSMRDLPLCNPALPIEAIGFRTHEDHAIGVVVTPWLISIVAAALTPDSPLASVRPGEALSVTVPGGRLDVVATAVEGCGMLGMASLFSPVDEFDAVGARVAAEAAVSAVFDPDLLAPPPPEPRALDRRSLLRGRLAEPGAPAP